MMRRVLWAGLLCMAGAASAQQPEDDIFITPLEDPGQGVLRPLDDPNEGIFMSPPEDPDQPFYEPAPEPEDPEEQVVRAETAPGAVLRALDKVSGDTQDLQMTAGETRVFGRLSIMLGECRYPADNPDGDAYAYLEIRPEGEAEPLFDGWMVASSPALNALEHPRYDVWVLRCTTS